MDSINAKAESFTYDNLDRLTGITYMARSVLTTTYSGNGNISNKYNGGAYAYDPIKVHAVKTVTKTTGTNRQDIQNITYTKFNKAENIQQWTPVTNKLLTYAITYGPDEQRVKTVYTDTVSVVTTKFYSRNYEKEIKGSTTRQIHYITGGTGLVAVYIKWTGDINKDSLYYVCTDRQGSITALLKQNGQVSERYSYDAWGCRRNPANWADFNVKAPRLIARGYTGHEMLDGFGLINMNGRMYDPIIGRVLSPDAFVQAPGYTQSYNRYSYCLNNPLRYTDPSGWLTAAAYESYVNTQFNWLDGMANSSNYSFGSTNGGSGVGSSWSDGLHDEYTNFMLMGSRRYDNMYGSGSYAIGRGLASNPALQNQWRQGMINIEKVRENGGYYVPVATQYNNSAKTWIDTPEGRAILLSGPSTIMQWVAVKSLSSQGGNTENDGFDVTQKIVGAFDFTVASTYAAVNTVQNLGYGKVLVKLGGKEIVNKIPLVSALISVGQGMQNGFKTSNYVDIGLNVGLVVLDGLLLTNPVGWVITAGSFGADLYFEYNYGESWTEHAFNHK